MHAPLHSPNLAPCRDMTGSEIRYIIKGLVLAPGCVVVITRVALYEEERRNRQLLRRL